MQVALNVNPNSLDTGLIRSFTSKVQIKHCKTI